jgi:hypothetical protein
MLAANDAPMRARGALNTASGDQTAQYVIEITACECWPAYSVVIRYAKEDTTMKITRLLLAATAVFAASVTAHAQPLEKTFPKAAVAGRTSHLDSYYAVKLDCTPVDWADVRIAQQPQNGKAVTSKGSVLMYYSEENPRKSCNGKPVEAIRLMYTPNDDARGDDRIVVEVVYSSGESRRFTYELTVK